METQDNDTKATEEKALNYFKAFIEDSKVISQYIDDNDKEPCWDGHLYLYSEGKRDKEHLQGRVPVQIKGTEVSRFVTKKWKFKLEKADLKAYLNEPTFFIVCQIKKDSKERKLFYRELLPGLVKKLLEDMGKCETRKTLFHPLTEELKEFEDQLKVFLSNSQKMVSFANAKPLSMADAVNKGIKEFSFIAPAKFSDRLELYKYLSTHSTYLYAKISKELNIDMPLSDGPAQFAFMRQDEGEVKVGDKVFFKGYKSEIKEGRLFITVADVLTINIPLDAKDKVKPVVKMTTKSKYLKEAIHDAEFAVALNDVGMLSIGPVNLQLAVNEKEFVDGLRKNLENWRDLEKVLEKLHVTKPFDISRLSKDQERLINVLIETVGKGHTVKLPGQESTLLTMEISNITLLLWCAAGKDGICAIGDFFDKSIRLSYKYNGKDAINVSPFSYLQNEKYWEKIDNIDYDSLIESAQKAAEEHEFCYHMSNYDVLAMISAADALEHTDEERSKKLLTEASKLNEWLIENEPKKEMKSVHSVNKMQILKRQRLLSNEEKQELEEMLKNEEIENSLKVAVNLLLDRKAEATVIFASLSVEDQKRLQNFPIWRLKK